MRVNHRPNQGLVRVSIVKLWCKQDVARFTNLSDFEIIRFVQFMEPKNDLAIQNDHDSVLWRDYDKIVLLFVYNFDILYESLCKVLVLDPTEEWEHVQIFGQKLKPLFF